MNRTENYNLPQFEPTDTYKLEDYNEAYRTIDEKLKEANDKGDSFNDFKNNGGTINGDLSVTGSINLSGTQRVMNFNGDTIIATGAESKYLYLRPNSANSETGQIVLKGNITSIDGNVAINSNSKFYIGNTEYCQSGINNWGANDNFVLHLNSGKCFIASDGVNRNNALGHPEQPWNDLYLGLPSVSTNGYTKLPNGLILQWGSVMFNENAGHTGIKSFGMYAYFPIAFPNAVLNYTMSIATNGYDQNKIKALINRYDATDRSKLHPVVSVESSGSWHCYVTWTAIGY